MTNVRRLEKLEKSKKYRESRALRSLGEYLFYSVPHAYHANSRAFLLEPDLPELWRQVTIAELEYAGEPLDRQASDNQVLEQALNDLPDELARELIACKLLTPDFRK